MPEHYRMSREQWFAERSAKQDRDQQALADATATVALFNGHMTERKSPLFWPTVGTALIAAHHWDCKTSGVDRPGADAVNCYQSSVCFASARKVARIVEASSSSALLRLEDSHLIVTM